MRWSLDLKSPYLIAGSHGLGLPPEKLEAVTPTLALGPDAAGRTAKVWLTSDGVHAEVAIVAGGVAGASPRPDYPEWYFRNHIVVAFDPAHDHGTRWMYSVDDAGKAEGGSVYTAPGEEPGEGPSKTNEKPPAAQGEFRSIQEHVYFARLTLPAEALGTSPEVPAGLMLKVGFHEEAIVTPLQWPQPVRWSNDMPLTFGDIYTTAPAVAVEAVEFPEPAWGGAPSTVVLHLRRSKNAPTSGTVRVEVNLPTDSDTRQTGAAWKSESETLAVRVPVVFPHRGKWANTFHDIARLRLALLDSGEKRLWAAEFPFGFDAGVIVRERYGRRGKQPAPRPDKSDPDFVNKFRAYVLTRLPDYRPRTTREGAPSDFYLEDRDGEAHLDLSAADALDKVASMLAERFGVWQDALCGAALWMYHPRVTRHSGTWSSVSGKCEVRSIPRMGGCFCGDTTRLGASLAERIGRKMNVELKGLSMGLRGHLTTLVRTPIGRVVIDGMHGMFYHALDNARLATLEELREQREVSERMWYYPKAGDHHFFYKNYTQVIRPWVDGPLEWPSADSEA